MPLFIDALCYLLPCKTWIIQPLIIPGSPDPTKQPGQAGREPKPRSNFDFVQITEPVSAASSSAGICALFCISSFRLRTLPEMKLASSSTKLKRSSQNCKSRQQRTLQHVCQAEIWREPALRVRCWDEDRESRSRPVFAAPSPRHFSGSSSAPDRASRYCPQRR